MAVYHVQLGFAAILALIGVGLIVAGDGEQTGDGERRRGDKETEDRD